MFFRIIEKIKQLYYTRYLVWKIGTKPKNLKVMGRVWVQNGTVSFGENVILYPNVSFTGNGHISIGNDVKIGEGTILYANKNGGLYIGDHTSIAAKCYIIDTEHRTELQQLICRQPLSSEPVYIGRDVWLGTDVTVLKGAHVMDGSVIGAKSLVNSVIPKNCVAYGIPAKVKRSR